MDVKVVDISQIKLLTGGSKVPVLIPEAPDYSVDAGNQHIATNIEFSPVIEQRSVQICLNYERFSFPVCMGLFLV
jgi:hypothetical protein